MYNPFNATVVGSTDFDEVYVAQAQDGDSNWLPVMAIITPIMEVHITKEQAMQFFGLVESHST